MLRWGTRRYLSINSVREARRGYAIYVSGESNDRKDHDHHGAGKHVSKREQYKALPPDWKAVIGVEVHAQLKSSRKLFSSAPSYETTKDAENTFVAPFDAALPGALPSLQMEPLRLALKACLALECQVAEWTSFDRKHYFYPDLTSGYQISQKYSEGIFVEDVRFMR